MYNNFKYKMILYKMNLDILRLKAKIKLMRYDYIMRETIAIYIK